MQNYSVYILHCSDDSYYIGITSELDKRIIQHKTGHFEGSYTSKRLPVELVYFEKFFDVNNAISREKQLKGWSRKKKEALIQGKQHLLKNLSKKRF